MKATTADWRDGVAKLNPCADAMDWIRTQESAGTAWANCQRGDWLLWLCGKLAGKPWSAARKKLVLTACECARLALPYVKAGDDRPLIAIETAERWARGEGATRKEVMAAADAAAAARRSAAAYAAAAFAAADADADAAADADRTATLKQCADIVRTHYPHPPEMQS